MTRLEKDGDYALEGPGARGRPYFNSAFSCLTLRVFEENHCSEATETADWDLGLAQSVEFADKLAALIYPLEDFLENGDREKILVFERRKRELAGLEGIAAFWSALLNIRLNSIPLVNVQAGVAASADACRRMQEMILRGTAEA
ncbi:MAG: hypothetical protein GF344_07860 [Chitinivibrionales bacterium]|nr:hypothetical protein [Chitinivibrionales bacterium]MBD3356804.1 hypothetical protein [Chitinivibrionales bacterium]